MDPSILDIVNSDNQGKCTQTVFQDDKKKANGSTTVSRYQDSTIVYYSKDQRRSGAEKRSEKISEFPGAMGG